MKKIPLNGKYGEGKFALVSDEDYEWLSKYDWYCTDKGYVVRYGKNKKQIRMHCEIVKAPKGMIVDHIDGDKLNNQRSNLRPATRQQNRWNSKKPITGENSQYKGVYKERGRWVAKIAIDGKKRYIGSYDSELDAAYAYNVMAQRLFGEFARLNVLPDDYDPTGVKIEKQFSSKYRGVRLMSWGKYTATFIHQGKRYYLGSYRDEKEAALAYNKKALEILGDKAILNDVPMDYVSPIGNLHKRNKSGYRGVSQRKSDGKWMAYVWHQGRTVHVGVFDTAIEAAKAYNAKALELLGDKAKLNIIPEEVEND